LINESPKYILGWKMANLLSNVYFKYGDFTGLIKLNVNAQ